MSRIGDILNTIGQHFKKHWPTIKGVVGDVVGKIFPAKRPVQ
jgi:hypothetical protein